MTTELFIWVLATNLFTLILSSIYFAVRVDELRRDQQLRMQQANFEMMAVRKMIHQQRMQSRVLGAVPVSRLIGGDE